MPDQFLHDERGEECQLSFEPVLFNTPLHLQLQSDKNWESFYLLREGKKIANAAIHFHLENEIARSPRKASFGGAECDDQIDEEQIIRLLQFASEKLFQKGARQIIVTQQPSLQSDERIPYAFAKAGFDVKASEIDSFIKIGKAYEDQLQERKAKKLRSLRRTNLTADIFALEKLPEVYQFILHARKKKGYELSMTFQQITELAQAFPENVFLFSVMDQHKIIAASVCIKIKSNWLYDFYHDHDSEYDSESPILLLMETIYTYCLHNSFEWLELGTSMVGAEVNEGLLAFKKRLGAMPFPKLTFEKVMS